MASAVASWSWLLPRRRSEALPTAIPAGRGLAGPESAQQLGLPAATLTTLYEAQQTAYVPQAFGNEHRVGRSLKYTEWWTTTSAVHLWEKPAHEAFHGITPTLISGGGGGGSGHGANGSHTGAGGEGGAVAVGFRDVGRFVPADELPEMLVIVVGHGGQAGGWDGLTDERGHLIEDGDGGDGGWSAILLPSAWTALGGDGRSRHEAFSALDEQQRADGAIVYCEEGFGGVRSSDSELAETGRARGREEPWGPRAHGGYHNHLGATGAGGGDEADDPTLPFGGGIGAGGAAGGSAVDTIWKNLPFGQGGIIGRLAGMGGFPKGPVGSHDGSTGGRYGGGGGGGQWQDGSERRSPGGFGAPGVCEIIERWGSLHLRRGRDDR